MYPSAERNSRGSSDVSCLCESAAACGAGLLRAAAAQANDASTERGALTAASVDATSLAGSWPTLADPTKVVRMALENAVSVAGVLLLSEATMTEAPEPAKRNQEPMEP